MGHSFLELIITEHWQRSVETDAELMKGDGAPRWSRMAEFFLALAEPQEGKYDFAWPERYHRPAGPLRNQDDCGNATAAPPAWDGKPLS